MLLVVKLLTAFFLAIQIILRFSFSVVFLSQNPKPTRDTYIFMLCCISTVAQRNDQCKHNEIKMFYARNLFSWEIHEAVCEMGGCSFIFAVSIISNTKYSEDIGRKKIS